MGASGSVGNEKSPLQVTAGHEQSLQVTAGHPHPPTEKPSTGHDKSTDEVMDEVTDEESPSEEVPARQMSQKIAARTQPRVARVYRVERAEREEPAGLKRKTLDVGVAMLGAVMQVMGEALSVRVCEEVQQHSCSCERLNESVYVELVGFSFPIADLGSVGLHLDGVG